MLTGTYTAIVTPFRNGKIDFAALRRLIGRQIQAGVDGIVPVGTTGESPTLNYQEHIEVIARSVEFAGGKIKVMAGSGGNSTSEAVYLTAEAEKAGELLGLTRTEQALLSQLPRGVALWRVGQSSFLVEHQLGEEELALADTDAAMRPVLAH